MVSPPKAALAGPKVRFAPPSEQVGGDEPADARGEGEFARLTRAHVPGILPL
jgi:hypothetical protein